MLVVQQTGSGSVGGEDVWSVGIIIGIGEMVEVHDWIIEEKIRDGMIFVFGPQPHHYISPPGKVPILNSAARWVRGLDKKYGEPIDRLHDKISIMLGVKHDILQNL